MKKLLSVLFCIILVVSATSCEKSAKELDELSYSFIEAMLIRDEDAMKHYIHPDYVETALPDDDFYVALEENHFFSLGNDITALASTGKNKIGDTSVEGELTQCLYVVRTNELFYNVELMILDNENGFGIIAVSASLNTEPEYYIGNSEVE